MQVLGAGCTPDLTFAPSCHGGHPPNMEETLSGNPPIEGEIHPLTGRWLNPRWKLVNMIKKKVHIIQTLIGGFHRLVNLNAFDNEKESHVKTLRKVTPSHVSRSAFRQNLIWAADGGGGHPVPEQAPLLHHLMRQDTVHIILPQFFFWQLLQEHKKSFLLPYVLVAKNLPQKASQETVNSCILKI